MLSALIHWATTTCKALCWAPLGEVTLSSGQRSSRIHRPLLQHAALAPVLYSADGHSRNSQSQGRPRHCLELPVGLSTMLEGCTAGSGGTSPHLEGGDPWGSWQIASCSQAAIGSADVAVACWVHVRRDGPTKMEHWGNSKGLGNISHVPVERPGKPATASPFAPFHLSLFLFVITSQLGPLQLLRQGRPPQTLCSPSHTRKNRTDCRALGVFSHPLFEKLNRHSWKSSRKQ